MLPKDVKAILRKVLDTGFTIFKSIPDFFLKGLIYCMNEVIDLFKE